MTSGSDRGGRAALEARLAALLDEALSEEPPPAGVPAELLEALDEDGGDEVPSAGDLYRLQAAVTAVAREVHLQGRSVDRLSESMAPLADLPAAVRGLAAGGTAPAAGSDRAPWREAIEALVDARDRLARGLELSRTQLAEARAAADRSWLLRLAGGPAVRAAIDSAAALEQGTALALERLEELLSARGVVEIPCEGMPFDPEVMRVMEVDPASPEPEGTVLEVYRRGYTWAGALLRPAGVRVAGGGS
jgi:molecular chaperone GrpE